MSPEELRLQALRIACESLGQTSDADIMRRASRFATFLIDGDAGQSPRATINAALDAANVS